MPAYAFVPAYEQGVMKRFHPLFSSSLSIATVIWNLYSCEVVTYSVNTLYAYRALRNLDELEVCLKQIPLNASLSETEIQREAKILSEFNDEHIIKYYGSFVESDNCYIVMEYAKEGSLDKMIAVCFEVLFITMFVALSFRGINYLDTYSLNEKYFTS